MNFSEMTPTELRAAMKGGTVAWGVIGSATGHVRYKLKLPKIKARRKCSCGCGGKATHAKMANGVCLGGGCELSVQRWVSNKPAVSNSKNQPELRRSSPQPCGD